MQGVWGLTGGIGSGKSTVGAIIRAHGGEVIDADQVSRDVVAPGQPALAQIVERFGEEYLRSDGTLNREKLGAHIFSDDEARKALNGIVHPAVFVESMQRMQRALQSGSWPVFYDAALLVDNDSHGLFDGLVVIDVNRETQIERVMERNELSYDEAASRIDAQASREDRCAVADFIIDNNGPQEALDAQVEELFAFIRNRSGDSNP